LLSLDAGQLLQMAPGELDALYRASPAGEIPRGEGKGTLLLAPGTKLGEAAARAVRRLAWQGKDFDPERGELRNEVLPVGMKALAAKVYKAPSWVDGNECIVLDYAHTSLVARWIRDEIREVAPGLYLGIAYWRKLKVAHFALSFPPETTAS
jgi:hypothetical protein